MECSTSRRSFTATVHVRRTTTKSVAYSLFVRHYGPDRDLSPGLVPPFCYHGLLWIRVVLQHPAEANHHLAGCCCPIRRDFEERVERWVNTKPSHAASSLVSGLACHSFNFRRSCSSYKNSKRLGAVSKPRNVHRAQASRWRLLLSCSSRLADGCGCEGDTPWKRPTRPSWIFVSDLWPAGRASLRRARRRLEISRKTRHLVLDLPIGSKEGPYDVGILTDTGDQLMRATGMAELHDHNTDLRVDVDLSSVRAGAYSLGVRQPSLEWTRYPIRVF